MLAHLVEDMLIDCGINPPDRGSKTTCPSCSESRKKRNEKCLKIRVDHEREIVSWFCFHCKMEGTIK